MHSKKKEISKKVIFTLGTLFSMGLLTGNLQAATSVSECTYFIAPNGSDKKGTGSANSPWETIDHASSKLRPGMTLCARGGIYYGQGGRIWHSSGKSNSPVTFTNYPKEEPVFDGEWGETGTNGNFLIFTNNSWIVVDGIKAQHFADEWGNGTIDITQDGGPVNDIIIQNCKFYDNGTHYSKDHHIYLAAGSKNITIRNNLFVRASASAVQANHTPAPIGIKIYNNVMIGGSLMKVSGGQAWGIMMSDGNDVQIYNNTIYGMRIGGIEFNYNTAAPAGPYFVQNNLIVKTGDAAIRVTSPYTKYFSSDYNLFFGNKTDVAFGGKNMTLSQFASSTSNDKHSISADPLFVSSGSNFHLTSKSPAIDKGKAMNALALDIEGSARPSGAALDIGAYEYKSAASASPKVSFSASTLSFANTDVSAQSAAKTLTISNSGNAPLIIKSLKTMGDFSVAPSSTCLSGKSYAPGSNCIVNVIFAPTTAGVRSGSLSVESNSVPSAINISLSGTGVAVKPVASISVNALDFGYVKVGTKSTIKIVTLTNTGNAPLTITQTFAMSPNFGSGGLGTCKLNVAYVPGQSCTASVVFLPRALGLQSGSMTMVTNASTQSVTLSGKGSR